MYVYPQVIPPASGSVPTPLKNDSIPKAMLPTSIAPSAATTVKPSDGQVSLPSRSAIQNTETGTGKAQPMKFPPQVEAIRPVGSGEAAITPIIPTKKVEVPIPQPEPPFKSPVRPMVETPGGLPSLVLPKEAETRDILKGNGPEGPKKSVPIAIPGPAPADPGMNLPTATPRNTSPSLTLPGAVSPAVPSAAPALPDPLIPPSSVPAIPNPGKPDALPSLTLPPDVPVAPTVKSESISRSSPLTGSSTPSVNMFPVISAEKATDGYRVVGFFNHSNRDHNLTIEGRTVKLPAKSYLEAKLGQTFTWGYGDRPVVRERVPDGAVGLDVVIRD
jgi:hypothetical protein